MMGRCNVGFNLAPSLAAQRGADGVLHVAGHAWAMRELVVLHEIAHHLGWGESGVRL